MIVYAIAGLFLVLSV